ncbi:Thioredoxin, partial [Oryctes borbonicus]
ETLEKIIRPTYKSYSYYTEQFGIYDDDPLVITLSKSDYELNVLDDNQAWFINFYAPHCHHCQTLASVWRKLAQEMEGVIKIAAVNCEEDNGLCYQMDIDSYPMLLYYEKQAHLFEGEYYRGSRTFEDLEDFVLSKLDVKINKVGVPLWNDEIYKKQDLLLFLCSDTGAASCPEEKTQIKLATSLEGLVSIGVVTDEELAKDISQSDPETTIVLWQAQPISKIHKIKGSDHKEIVNDVLSHLPNPNQLTDEDFRDIRNKLREGQDKPWLLCFFLGAATELDLQLKRLPIFLPNINIGLIHCGRNSGLCTSLHINHYPAWGILKAGGAFELHHGRGVLNEIVAFAKDGIKSTNFHALSPADFEHIIQSGQPWFIDWYAPWCPPCRNLMPELRKASQQFSPEVIQFGSIDCTAHQQLCIRNDVRSYPSLMVYNTSKVHHFHGTLKEESVVEFVRDVLNPTVINLDDSSFALLMRKPVDEMWIVDFYAPWCGPCQRLSPQWRALANELVAFKQVKLADIDCVANSELCSAQNVRSYPTIRMYPLGSKGLNTVVMYNGHRDTFSMKKWIISFLPSPVVALTAKEFEKQILTKKFFLPWLIDFYAPWCHPCINFEPEFTTVGERLQGKVRTGKVDCEMERDFCYKSGITSYPTVMLYLSPKEKYEIHSQVPKEIIRNVKQIIKEKSNSEHDEL